MNFENIIAVSGLPGLYNIAATRNNGVVVSDMDTGKTKFCSVRQHQFTPLETVAIYTYTDTVPLKEIFKNMKFISEESPVVSPKISNDEIKKYFRIALPEFDEDRVHISDMKKVIKWYKFLEQRNMLTIEDEEE